MNLGELLVLIETLVKAGDPFLENASISYTPGENPVVRASITLKQGLTGEHMAGIFSLLGKSFVLESMADRMLSGVFNVKN